MLAAPPAVSASPPEPHSGLSPCCSSSVNEAERALVITEGRRNPSRPAGWAAGGRPLSSRHRQCSSQLRAQFEKANIKVAGHIHPQCRAEPGSSRLPSHAYRRCQQRRAVRPWAPRCPLTRPLLQGQQGSGGFAGGVPDSLAGGLWPCRRTLCATRGKLHARCDICYSGT